MPIYSVWPFVNPVQEELGPEATMLTTQQLQQRIERAFICLRDILVQIPHIERITEHPSEASATIVAETDIASDLKEHGLGFIRLDNNDSEKTVEHLFFIRPSPGSKTSLEVIEDAVGTHLGGRRAPAANTFYVPYGNADGLSALLDISRILDKKGIAVEIGLVNAAFSGFE